MTSNCYHWKAKEEYLGWYYFQLFGPTIPFAAPMRYNVTVIIAAQVMIVVYESNFQ